MKLFGIFAAAASVAATIDGDRAWANRPEFFTNPDSWWNSEVSANHLSSFKDVVDEYFQTYELSSDDKNVVRVAKIWQKLITNYIGEMEKQRARSKCSTGRKESGVIDGELNNKIYLRIGQQQAINMIYWDMAKWVRNELWESCPNQTIRLVSTFTFRNRPFRY